MFTFLVAHVSNCFRTDGFEDALEVHLTKAQALKAQQDPAMVAAVIMAAVDPDPDTPTREGKRLFATISGVRIYVEE